MSVSPEIIHVVRQWVQKAEEDLITAEHTLTLLERCPFATICFHAQQCVEKYLKALLTLHAVPFPRSHDLPGIHALLPDQVVLEVSLDELRDLNRFSVESRYPGDWDPITRQEAENAVASARRIRARARAVLPLECVEDL